ncbi:TonB-dependent receptor [Hyalangium rubrum]|uniref:TonB-dependent receptor n=1 Tax=Hyalangium rubrum TaxID=3103134 RepID=A0ABU5HB16_9BACT|nr:TonB-dependent receptor [Hyalangium sp. s54d21]MDY7230490.1 TonB-dependent receptor [Hyalangium sp. s54d21]
MKLRTLGLALFGAAGLGVLPACTKDEAPPPPATPPASASATGEAAKPAPAAPAPVAVSGRGTVRGVVKFTGQPPAMADIAPSSDPACEGMVLKEQAVLVKDGKLQNVLVRVRGAVPGAPAAPTEPVVVDQSKCTYLPRVQGAVSGQALLVKNSDGTMHNVRGMAGTRALFNLAQPPSAPPVTKPMPGEVELLQLKCDVHAWMRGYISVSPHPYFATTGEDGAFSMEGVPEGTYTLEAWHETFGTKTAEVTVKKEAVSEAAFEFTATDKAL